MEAPTCFVWLLSRRLKNPRRKLATAAFNLEMLKPSINVFQTCEYLNLSDAQFRHIYWILQLLADLLISNGGRTTIY